MTTRPVRAIRPLILLTLLMGLTQSARADDVSISLVGLALKGQGKPTINVSVEKPLLSLEIELTRSDGKVVQFKSKRVPAGSTRSFALDQPEGTFHYDGKAIARFTKGPPQELALTFDASLYGPLQLKVGDQAVNLTAHTVTFSADRALASLHVQVQADDGRTVAEYDEPEPQSQPNRPITTTWHADDEAATVLKIRIRATDTFGIYRDVDLYPWKFEIPHEDVLFDTGKSDIVDTEKPKLDAAYEKLVDAIRKYGRWAQVQLFVAGHTDTVGDAAMNKVLSEARAKSIAHYFRARGIKIPIYYTGYGKDGLLVPTPDNTPEPRNRRAAYIVSVLTPPGPHWTRVP